MKRFSVLVLSLAVLMCASCDQKIVSNDVPAGGTTVATTVAAAADDIIGDDIPEIDTDADADITDVQEDVLVEEDSSDEAEDTSADEESGEADEEYEDDSEEEYEDEDYEEPEYDYDPAAVAAKAKELNGVADSFRTEIGAFLSKASLSGYGMTAGGEGTFMSIYIEEGIWMVSVDDTDCFSYTEEMEWFGYGEADSTTSAADAEDPDTLFALELMKKFPGIKNGSAGAWIQDGSCVAAYFTENTTAGDGQMDYMMGPGGWLESYCEWDGYNQGMSDEDNIVGTSPVLGFAVEE